MSTTVKKSLGQHWLRDKLILSHIANLAQIDSKDTILEIGPGLGNLTSHLLRYANNVVAVEYDEDLALKLPNQFPGKNLTVKNGDILSFNLNELPPNYKVVANVPYYITSKIIKLLLTAKNKPSLSVLLVQKEVAIRLAAKPGDMSILAISAQLFADVSLGDVVEAKYFTPPPKVDSQVVILKTKQESFLKNVTEKDFFKIVKAGFSSKRKKLRSSLSGGLDITKSEVENLLDSANIDPNMRAESLSMRDWETIASCWRSSHG